MAWCLWYVEMRYGNRYLEPEYLINSSIQKINKMTPDFTSYIRNYGGYLVKQRNIILNKINFNKKLWNVKTGPKNDFKKYMSKINVLYCHLH